MRSNRECDYKPVPEEVNRATREKKATAKAGKTTPYPITPMTTYSPYFAETPVFEAPYFAQSQPLPLRPVHRRSVSTPNFDIFNLTAGTPLPSPGLPDANQWMYGAPALSSPLIPSPMISPQRPFPSVLQHTPVHDAYLAAHSGMGTPEPSLSTSWSTPNLHQSTRGTPMSAQFDDGWAYQASMGYTPSPMINTHIATPSPLSHLVGGMSSLNTSPTLAPEIQKDQLVGLGIGMQNTVIEVGSGYMAHGY